MTRSKRHAKKPLCVRTCPMIFCLGGAFNPPTIAHKAIYLAVKKTYDVRAFIYLPVGDVYEKPMVKAAHRIAMLEAMMHAYPDVIIDPLETLDEDYQGAIASLRRLTKSHQEKVIFVLGLDQAKTLMTWKEAPVLLSEFQFLVIQRPGDALSDLTPLKSTYPTAIYDILTLDMDVSSTAYRSTHDETLIDLNVSNYIHRHGLYKER